MDTWKGTQELSETLKEITTYMFHVKHQDNEMDKREKLEQFKKDVLEKNKEFNLTSITDDQEFEIKHFEDSLSLIRILPDLDEKKYRVIDIGTGAGFPGIPLAIMYPNLEITLMDSLQKRINFINEEISRLGITNAHAIHARAEDLARNGDFREKYDISVSRAVANLSTLMEYTTPFIHKGGGFVAYKSGDIDKEIENARRALKLLRCRIERKVEFQLNADKGERTLLLIRKDGDTPAKYPRKAGTPSRQPL